MPFSAVVTSNNIVEIRRIPEGVTIDQLADDDGKVTGIVREFSKGTLIQDDAIPDKKYQSAWVIQGNEIIIGPKAITDLQDECKKLIDERTEAQCCANIVVNGREYQVSPDAMLSWIGSTSSMTWILADNTKYTLTAVEGGEVAAAVIARKDTLINAARDEKDALPNTIEQLEIKRAELANN